MKSCCRNTRRSARPCRIIWQTQIDEIITCLGAARVKSFVQQDGVEADDIIATLARIGGTKPVTRVVIASADKDFFQLVGAVGWDAESQ